LPPIDADVIGDTNYIKTTILDDTADVHPAALLCVKVLPELAVTNPVPDINTTLGVKV
jgi:hypothetical protein